MDDSYPSHQKKNKSQRFYRGIIYSFGHLDELGYVVASATICKFCEEAPQYYDPDVLANQWRNFLKTEKLFTVVSQEGYARLDVIIKEKIDIFWGQFNSEADPLPK